MLSQSDNAVSFVSFVNFINSVNSVNSVNSFKSVTFCQCRQSITVCHYVSQSQALIPLNSVSPHILSLFRIILRKLFLVNQSSGIL